MFFLYSDCLKCEDHYYIFYPLTRATSKSHTRSYLTDEVTVFDSFTKYTV